MDKDKKEYGKVIGGKKETLQNTKLPPFGIETVNPEKKPKNNSQSETKKQNEE